MLDPVTLAVLNGRLVQIADEMDATLYRSAFNPIIAEAHDACHGLYHSETGATLVQGTSGLPIFVGVMAFAVKAVIDKVRQQGGLQQSRQHQSRRQRVGDAARFRVDPRGDHDGRQKRNIANPLNGHLSKTPSRMCIHPRNKRINPTCETHCKGATGLSALAAPVSRGCTNDTHIYCARRRVHPRASDSTRHERLLHTRAVQTTHGNALFTLLSVVFNFEPNALITVMHAAAINAASIPYSSSDTPSSALANRRRSEKRIFALVKVANPTAPAARQN